MKGKPEIILVLNKLLSAESAAILQYSAHSSKVSNWGYSKLASYIMGRAKEEMKHFDMLLDRLEFLEGDAEVAIIAPIHVATEVPKMFANDEASELEAIANYNEAIQLCKDLKDNDTAEMLEDILEDETKHIDAIENGIKQISDMTLPLYLTQQI